MRSVSPLAAAEDPVVCALPIHFHAGLSGAGGGGAFHLLSYPLRPAYRPVELPTTARMRPARGAWRRCLRGT